MLTIIIQEYSSLVIKQAFFKQSLICYLTINHKNHLIILVKNKSGKKMGLLNWAKKQVRLFKYATTTDKAWKAAQDVIDEALKDDHKGTKLEITENARKVYAKAFTKKIRESGNNPELNSTLISNFRGHLIRHNKTRTVDKTITVPSASYYGDEEIKVGERTVKDKVSATDINAGKIKADKAIEKMTSHMTTEQGGNFSPPATPSVKSSRGKSAGIGG